MRIRAAIIAGITLALTGCATSIPMSGETVAVGKLRRDVLGMLPAYAAVATGCREPITQIHTEIIEAPQALTADDRGHVTAGEFKERWLLTMCGGQEPIIVTFKPDGHGGSQISLSKGRK